MHSEAEVGSVKRSERKEVEVIQDGGATDTQYCCSDPRYVVQQRSRIGREMPQSLKKDEPSSIDIDMCITDQYSLEYEASSSMAAPVEIKETEDSGDGEKTLIQVSPLPKNNTTTQRRSRAKKDILYSPHFHDKSLNSRSSALSSSRLNADYDSTLKNEDQSLPTVKEFKTNKRVKQINKSKKFLNNAKKSTLQKHQHYTSNHHKPNFLGRTQATRIEENHADMAKATFFSNDNLNNFPSLFMQQKISRQTQQAHLPAQLHTHNGGDEPRASYQLYDNRTSDQLLQNKHQKSKVNTFSNMAPSQHEMVPFESASSTPGQRQSRQEQHPQLQIERLDSSDNIHNENFTQALKQQQDDQQMTQQQEPQRMQVQSRQAQEGESNFIEDGSNNLTRQEEARQRGLYSPQQVINKSNQDKLRRSEVKAYETRQQRSTKQQYRCRQNSVESPSNSKINFCGKKSAKSLTKMKNLQLYSSSAVKIPMSAAAPPINYFSAQVQSQSDARSSQRESRSRSAAKVPLVMRHCYANNLAKQQQVEANRAEWLQFKQSKVASPVGAANIGTLTSQSPFSSQNLRKQSPLSCHISLPQGESSNIRDDGNSTQKNRTLRVEGRQKKQFIAAALRSVSLKKAQLTNKGKKISNKVELNDNEDEDDSNFDQRRSRNQGYDKIGGTAKEQVKSPPIVGKFDKSHPIFNSGRNLNQQDKKRSFFYNTNTAVGVNRDPKEVKSKNNSNLSPPKAATAMRNSKNFKLPIQGSLFSNSVNLNFSNKREKTKAQAPLESTKKKSILITRSQNTSTVNHHHHQYQQYPFGGSLISQQASSNKIGSLLLPFQKSTICSDSGRVNLPKSYHKNNAAVKNNTSKNSAGPKVSGSIYMSTVLSPFKSVLQPHQDQIQQYTSAGANKIYQNSGGSQTTRASQNKKHQLPSNNQKSRKSSTSGFAANSKEKATTFLQQNIRKARRGQVQQPPSSQSSQSTLMTKQHLVGVLGGSIGTQRATKQTTATSSCVITTPNKIAEQLLQQPTGKKQKNLLMHQSPQLMLSTSYKSRQNPSQTQNSSKSRKHCKFSSNQQTTTSKGLSKEKQQRFLGYQTVATQNNQSTMPTTSNKKHILQMEQSSPLIAPNQNNNNNQSSTSLLLLKSAGSSILSSAQVEQQKTGSKHNTKYLDTIESVEGGLGGYGATKNILQLQQQHHNTMQRTESTRLRLSASVVQEYFNDNETADSKDQNQNPTTMLYKMPAAAESPDARGRGQAQQTNQDDYTISRNSQLKLATIQSQTSYTQQLKVMENISLRKIDRGLQSSENLLNAVESHDQRQKVNNAQRSGGEEAIQARLIVMPFTDMQQKSSKQEQHDAMVAEKSLVQQQQTASKINECSSTLKLNNVSSIYDEHGDVICCSSSFLPSCTTISKQQQKKENNQRAGAQTLGQPYYQQQSKTSFQQQIMATKSKLKQFTKQRSFENKAPTIQQVFDQIKALEDTRENRKNIGMKIKSQLHSVHQSNQTSMINLSIAKTESAAFQPNNPLLYLRKMQQEKNYVWFAAYDEDVHHESFMRKISRCKDQCLPWEFVPWRLYDVQVILVNESSLCLRREPGRETLCKIYLVQMEQVHDIVRYKNQMCERKNMIRQGLLEAGEGFKPIDDLRKKYQVSRLQMTEENKNQSNHSTSFQSQLVIKSDEDSLNASVPDEGKEQPDGAAQIHENQHYVVTMEERREFDDLQDVENPPILDLIYHEQTAMGLPVVFVTNRDQSKLDEKILPQTPSYFKHLKSLRPDPEILIKMLQGLVQGFPSFTPEELMKNYIEQIPGITDKLSQEEINDILEKSMNNVDTIMSEQPPNTKLLTPQQTQKMFELMSNQQMDPTDLQSGYQSLDIYNEQQQNLIGVDTLGGSDRDVVFLGAESSSSLVEKNDTSVNQQLMIDQFNRDFQLQQQNFLANLASSGIKSGNGAYGVQSSDTSQVDNFIFQNNINRDSNDVSQEEYDQTPYRDGILQKCLNKKQFNSTNVKNSRNASSNQVRQESGNTTSYQGACQVVNFQQPFFQSNQWNNSGLDDSTPHAKLEQSQKIKFNRGSSQVHLSGIASPPFKQLRPLNSARKPGPAIFSGENSALMHTDQITNSSAFGRVPLHKKTIFSKHKYFNSNVPSTHRTLQNVAEHHQAGYELPVEDFVTNVESIKAVPHENSANQGSNSLFIQSGRSRNNTNKTQTNLNATNSRKGLSHQKPPLIQDHQNRFELSDEDIRLANNDEENVLFIVNDPSRLLMPQEDFEEVLVPGDQSYEQHNQHVITAESKQKQPYDQQLSDTNFVKNSESKKDAACAELDCTRPDIELFYQVSDIMNTNCKRQQMLTQSPSQEIVLEETKFSPIYSYNKAKANLSKKMHMPKPTKKRLQTEVKQRPFSPGATF